VGRHFLDAVYTGRERTVKYRILHILLHHNECVVYLSTAIGEQIRFTFPTYDGEVDWHTAFKYIRFFEPEHVIISHMIQAADGMTDAQEVSCG